MTKSPLHAPLLGWYLANARDLPWRRSPPSPWGVLVSEIMLQQTPVARVLPVWEAWMHRWPTPTALAAEPAAEAIRAWGRLGYPRRALRLHANAVLLVSDHGGDVPAEEDVLRTLPGVGEYTAAAVAAFAFGRRSVVLDTNVRRVLARLEDGRAGVTGGPTNRERTMAADLLPVDPSTAATWSVALMELGAVVCTARAPLCEECPVAGRCRWLAAGRPAGPSRVRSQPYEGTDRYVRGKIMQLLSESTEPVPASRVDAVWADADQRDRALESLLVDGLAERLPSGTFSLPRG